MIHPTAHRHTDTGFVLRMGSCPLFVVREGCGAVRVVPQILARVVEICPQIDGEPLEGRVVGILHPVLDTGPLLLGLMDCQPATEQSGIDNLI